MRPFLACVSAMTTWAKSSDVRAEWPRRCARSCAPRRRSRASSMLGWRLMTADRPHQPKSRHAAAGDASADTGWVLVGEIVGAFGIRGQVKLLPLTDFPERFERTKTLYLGDAHAPVMVLSAQQHKNIVLMTLAGVETADAAEKLRGTSVSIPEADLTP